MLLIHVPCPVGFNCQADYRMQADTGVKAITEYAIGQSNGMLATHLSRQTTVVMLNTIS
jgi:hypothetical protein